METRVVGQVEVTAPVGEVWLAWTTEAGVKTFFAPHCKIELRPGGAYEIYFDPDAPAGSKGSEGCLIMGLEEPRMLSFTWSAPPRIPEIRKQRTHVVLRFEEIPSGGTRVNLVNDGYGESPAWREALVYFNRAWNKTVLPRLQRRFEEGPVDWSSPKD
jgi:uncharacterized protein YndB with AHSA1/START domain